MASHAVSLSVWLWALGSDSLREGTSVASVETGEARHGSDLRSACPVSRNPRGPLMRPLFRLLSEG